VHSRAGPHFMMRRFSRRAFIGSVWAGTAWLPFPPRILAQRQGPEGGLEHEVASFDLGLLDDWLTPNELFFVRNHFAAPKISEQEWKLAFSGAVSAPFELSYEQLGGEPQTELAATLECAENPAGGGLVSNAQWSGVSLAALLKKAQPRAEARFVRFWGADGAASGGLGYARSIPISKAMSSDSLLALRMNGETLPTAHGFPARAIIPGWYAMDSVKWLRKVEVLSDAGNGSFMTAGYQRQRRSGTVLLPREPVRAMKVKSVFSRPLDGAILMGRRFVARGAAWAGPSRVRQVELSMDRGKSWQTAQLEPAGAASSQEPYSWVYWKYDWKIPAPGDYELLVRATDDQGQVQPAGRSPERLDPYEQNSFQRVRCKVTGAG
jgi:DMSO/TMAO reductase YedYZ molybdopterin-dependent catalytic subunit